MTGVRGASGADQRASPGRIALLTTGATIRSTPIAPLGAAAITALLLTLFAANSQDRDLALMGVRLATTALAIGVAFTLDDPAGHMKESVPHSLRYRRLNRIIYVMGVWILTLSTLLWLAASILPTDQQLPTPRLILEAGGQAGAGLAIAAFLYQTDPKPGRVAASALLGAVLISWLLPGPLRPWVHPEDPLWQVGQRIWIGVVATSLCLLAVLSWDSRTNRIRRRPLRRLSEFFGAAE